MFFYPILVNMDMTHRLRTTALNEGPRERDNRIKVLTKLNFGLEV
jgi:hypothetical protein